MKCVHLNYLILFITLFFFPSCEKELNISLKNNEKKIVVEGKIETGIQPVVTITNSIGFFGKIDFNSIEYISGAVVKVQDVNTLTTVTLKEYSVDTIIGGNHFSFSGYAPDFTDPVAMSFIGEIGHQYKLTIDVLGKHHEAVCKIPIPKPFDSIWAERLPGTLGDTFSIVKAYYTDPDTFGNAIRYETLVKRYIKTGEPEIFFTPFNAVYDDNIINGTKIPVTISMGYDKTKEYSINELNNLEYIKHGDTAIVKWSAIDAGVYKFWQTLSFGTNSIGNPFASPTNIQGNITNALGVWGGYAPIYYTVIDSL